MRAALALRRRRRAAAGLSLAQVLIGAAPAALADGPRLILVSFDGLRADVVTPERMPNLAALRDGGAAAAEALNDLPSVTMTNHATMLTGLSAKTHGVVLDFSLPGTIRFPTLFDFATQAGLRCAFFASKDKLRYFVHEGVCAVVDIDADLPALVDRFVAQLAPGGPDVLFLHFRDPDSTGHRSGWLSDPCLDAARNVDALFGRIVAAAAERPTCFLVTADHGGAGTNHFLNIPEDRRIPWIVSGPGIAAGQELAGTVSIADTTPTALWLLGVPVHDGLDGHIQTGLRAATETAEPAPAPIYPVGLPCALFAAPTFGFVLWRAKRGRRPRRGAHSRA